MATATQTVVGSVEMVPDGYVSLSSFGARKSGRNGRGTDRYEWLLDAYQNGKIDAVKVMRTVRERSGAVFVNREQAWEVIAKREAGRERERPADLFSSDSRNDSASILSRIDAIAEHLQSISRGIDRLCELKAAEPWQANG